MEQICLADAWMGAIRSIETMHINEYEIERVRRVYHVLLNQASLTTELSGRPLDGCMIHRSVHELPDTSFIVDTAKCHPDTKPGDADWKFSKPPHDSPPMFNFATLEILATVLSITWTPTEKLVK